MRKRGERDNFEMLYTGYLLSIVKIKRKREREREREKGEREREKEREERDRKREREQEIINIIKINTHLFAK